MIAHLNACKECRDAAPQPADISSTGVPWSTSSMLPSCAEEVEATVAFDWHADGSQPAEDGRADVHVNLGDASLSRPVAAPRGGADPSDLVGDVAAIDEPANLEDATSSSSVVDALVNLEEATASSSVAATRGDSACLRQASS